MNLENLKKYWLPGVFSLFVLVLCLPTAFSNLNDLGVISFFSHDEFYIMSLFEFYRTGDYDPISFTRFFDYGIYYWSLAQVLEFIEKFGVSISPGCAFGIIRGINLVSGLLGLFFFWRLLIRHFGNGWSEKIAFLGLVLTSSFVMHLDFSKPEPLTFLIVVLGMEYTLRIVEEPTRKNFFIATLLSGLGTAIKIFGVFLLPGIILAVFRRRESYASFLKIPLFLLVGLALFWWFLTPIYVPAIAELAQEFAQKNPSIAAIAHLSVSSIRFFWHLPILVFLAAAILYFFVARKRLQRSQNPLVSLTSTTLMVSSFFLSWFAFFSLVWIFFPRMPLLTYGNMLITHEVYGFEAASFLGGVWSSLKILYSNLVTFIGFYPYHSGFWGAFSHPDFPFLSDLLGLFGAIGYLFFIFYILKNGVSIFNRGSVEDWKKFIVFSVTLAFCSLIFYSAFHPQHIVPALGFFFLLSAYGFMELVKKKEAKGGRFLRGLGIFFMIGLGLTLALNGRATLENRMEKWNQRPGSKDVVWELQSWWRENVSADARILAGHPARVYVPKEYAFVSRFRDHMDFGVSREISFQRVIKNIRTAKADYIICNFGRGEAHEVLPPLESFIPNFNYTLIKRFHYLTKSGREDKIGIYQRKNLTKK